ncbi:serine repeat antigen, putative [Plasmodium gallinaceum]|uniref:Serine repeat antigen, putative n=2 Tax=Plasmodium gallinaceum TaxID=5849 RepID=A0A1J1GVT8_PLAGA|nr:serine repeat antigen, putative [Plasmodium gallinaceum]CRG95402.1 serine repeat antigen, putative [Plasmodium gallinaceum]
MRNCFLAGSLDFSKCILCEEKFYNIQPCIQHPQNFLLSKGEIKAFIELQEEDYLTREQMRALIEEIIKISLYRIKKRLNDEHSMSDDLKKKIKKLCLYSNFYDNYENARNHMQASVVEVEQHIRKIVKKFMNEKDNIEHMYDSLSNPALCLKDPGQWIRDRAGYKDIDIPSAGIIPEKKLFKSYMLNSLNNSLYSSKYNCNRQFCNRFADTNECEHNIRVLNQGKCGNCWAFASSTVISAYRCRKDLGFAEPSVKYVTLCKNKYNNNGIDLFGHYNDNICKEGGHIVFFLNTVEKTGMLPTSHDVPYYAPLKSSECPKSKSSWSNIWDQVNLFDKIYNGYMYHGFLKISFGDYVEQGKTTELINIIKDYIIDQGALFVSMTITEKLSFDHDGEKVMISCQHNETPDHALALIGFGDYIMPSGKKSSYWLIRNSWGAHWGDKGNFKLDVYGSPNCNGHVLYNAFPLLLEMNGKKINAPLPNDTASTDVKTRYDFHGFGSHKENNFSPHNMNIDRNRLYPNPFGDSYPFRKPNHNTYYDPINPYAIPRDQNYNPNKDSSYGNNDYAYPRDNSRDRSGIIYNRDIRNLRRVFKSQIIAQIGDFIYKRSIYSKRKDEIKEPYSCLRTFSMDSLSDSTCRNNCHQFISECKYSSSIGECLMKRSPNYKCIYCGM